MRKYLYGASAFGFGFLVLVVSFLRSASIAPAYGFSMTPTPKADLVTPSLQVVYGLPYPGKILPDNVLWYLKATRDKLQYMITRDSLKKADLALLFADKRLGASLILLENQKPDLAVSTLTKGEKYLEMAARDEARARTQGINTSEFLTKLATASLSHRQTIEEKMMPMAPEDLKPEIVKALDYSKNTYKSSRDNLNTKGLTAPIDPFN
jgi:hypothetical protein